MGEILLGEEQLTQGAKILSGTPEEAVLLLPRQGGGLSLPQLIEAKERYLTFYFELLEDHSLPLNFFFYSKDDPEGEAAFNLRFGVLPGVKALMCIDLNWLDGSELFPEKTPGQLKVVCHGRRLKKEEIHRVTFVNYPCFHDVKVSLSKLTLTNDYPQSFPLPDLKLIDAFGQTKGKMWDGKIENTEALKTKLNGLDQELPEKYTLSQWNEYGGWTGLRLTEGTGFFSKAKAHGRWWLVDPKGHPFFSMGPDCVGVRTDCRIDGWEKFMDWLPERTDPAFGDMYDYRGPKGDKQKESKFFSFARANLYRAFGESWEGRWTGFMGRQLKAAGMNTLGNWSDPRYYKALGLPYTTTLKQFPSTRQTVFRDFPDVFSPEYAENAEKAAQLLKEYREDPMMIGYFLGNEPAWAFVNHLNLAEEVLYNPARTRCRERLIDWLKEKYNDVPALSEAWKHTFQSFEDLYQPLYKVSGWSEQAGWDMSAFSRILLNEYIRIPSEACRKAAPHHMNLGLRWAWISDPDVVTGWEYFDVFSINCYSLDPTPTLNHVQELGVDRPILIGEFHFGALDRGLTATGLEGVPTQKDRGMAYRYYCERVAAHPAGVGCHYFQLYDQFALGRFDGENYNIGLFDICSQPYLPMLEGVRQCSERVYRIKNGELHPIKDKPPAIPMIAY